ncbi:phage tail tip protein J-related protein, partial [Escherichia coli]|uniref:phage tail tip protein J-related protein n=1 Tax=Escherichia coli TaxID=562 RepID=UPI004042AF43
AHFDGDQSGTVNGVTPPAVQHLTAEVTANSGEYQVLARWDTPNVVKVVSLMLRRTLPAYDGVGGVAGTAPGTGTRTTIRPPGTSDLRVHGTPETTRGAEVGGGGGG